MAVLLRSQVSPSLSQLQIPVHTQDVSNCVSSSLRACCYCCSLSRLYVAAHLVQGLVGRQVDEGVIAVLGYSDGAVGGQSEQGGE